MMKKLVVTKEQAERLRKAGYKGACVFGWIEVFLPKQEWVIREWNEFSLPALTIGELIEATGCGNISRVEFPKRTAWVVSGSMDTGAVAVESDSIMESLVRLFESQNESQREVKS